MTLAQQYIEGLRQAYLDAGENAVAEWRQFERVKHGIGAEEKAKLLEVYPAIPENLLGLLAFADGTYWREYGGEKIAFYFLGSDVGDGGYPYYLYSAEQLLEDKAQNYGDNFADLFYWYQEEQAEGGDDPYSLFVDERIRQDGSPCDWLCFSDCMNNGGSSSLFIDFTPAEGGKKGQIIRFLHDPDRLDVIADSFDEYLQMVMDNGYAFVDEEHFED